MISVFSYAYLPVYLHIFFGETSIWIFGPFKKCVALLLNCKYFLYIYSTYKSCKGSMICKYFLPIYSHCILFISVWLPLQILLGSIPCSSHCYHHHPGPLFWIVLLLQPPPRPSCFHACRKTWCVGIDVNKTNSISVSRIPFHFLGPSFSVLSKHIETF